MDQEARLMLLCRANDQLCALPIESVSETMRPLPITPFEGCPPFVKGLTIIRGTPIPVVDIGLLLVNRQSNPARFVTVKTGNRFVALAVDHVVGIRRVPRESFQDLPPLLQYGNAETISLIGTLDTELLLVLKATVLVPDSVWHDLKSRGSS